MGLSLSRSRRRRRNHDRHDRNHASLPAPPNPIDPSPNREVTNSSSPLHDPTTSSSSSTTTTTSTTTSTSHPVYSSSSSLNSQPSAPLLRPSAPPTFVFAANAPYPSRPTPIPSDARNFVPPMIDHANPSNGFGPVRLPLPPLQGPPPPPPYVSAKKIQNHVNVHKDTIKLNADANDSDSYLVSFTFDALVDGSIAIFYFAKEGVDCTFTPLYPDYYMPRRIHFEKGLGQNFFQPSGTGIDLGFFETAELANSSPAEDTFPLVISVEAFLPSLSKDVESIESLPTTSHNAQITQAVLEKNKEGQYQVRVIKQILWIDGVCYELHELYGIGNSDEAGFSNSDPGKECVICMTLPNDTAVLPCRHMCMCSECAKALRVQSNKCPICRQLIQELIGINVDKASS